MAQDQRIQEEQNTRKRANLLRIRYFDVRELKELPVFEGILSLEQMQRWHTVVLSQEKGRMILAVTVSTPQQAIREMRRLFSDYQVSFVMVSDSGFKSFMEVYNPPEVILYDDIDINPTESDKSIEDVTATIERVKAEDVFNYLIRQASLLSASDIHLETQEEHVRVRFRVDGVLHSIATMNYEKYRQLNSSIAVHANVSTDSPDPQTGHMDHDIVDDDGKLMEKVNMRIETIPTVYGQDSVIRLFQIQQDLLQVEHLGLSTRQRAIIDDIVSHPSGLVLSVGPTGSGKTTTLYSILNKLNNEQRKIVTLEDPVEYSLPGLVQIPVQSNKPDSFADKLRAVLRLDPDVIMVGEIRDADTARTALQASLSGHLVLSTFHAADTTAALARIFEFLGGNPLLTSAIRLVIAQRLVRKIDKDDREGYSPDERELSIIKQQIELLPEGVERPNMEGLKLYRPTITENSPFGYEGQTAVVEMLTMTPDLERMIQGAEINGLNSVDLRAAAIDSGMVTLLQNGILRAVKGETSLDEVLRVIG